MFSKIIGKGGQSIANLRSTSGAYIKGTNIDEDQRLVVISGGISHVILAFDMIMQLVFSHGAGSAVNSAPSAEFMRHGILSVETHTLVLLVEHGKVGRVVGQKGSTLQTLKQKSGAVVRVEKVPVEYAGISLRSVSLEGTVAAIQRAHAAIQEIFLDQLTSSRTGSGQQTALEQTQVSAYGNGGSSGSPASSVLSVPARGGYPGFPVAYPMLPPQSFLASASAPYGYSGSAGAMGQHSGFLAMSDAFGQSLPTAEFANNSGGGRVFSHQQQQGYNYSMPYQQHQRMPATHHPRPAQQALPQTQRQHIQQKEAPAQQTGALTSAVNAASSEEASKQKAASAAAPTATAPATATPAPSSESSLPDPTPADPSRALALTSPQAPPSTNSIANSPRDRPGWVAPLSASVLLSAGVPPSAVGQLVDLQTYLLRNFGLELAVAPAPEHAGSGGSLCPGTNGAVKADAVTIELVIAQRNQASPFELCFAVPSSCVGGIIGKGGKLLRALQAEFGVRVYVEKEDYLGQRIVCLTYIGCVQADTSSASRERVESEAEAGAEDGAEKQQLDDADNTDSAGLRRDIEVELDFDQLRTGDREAGEAAAGTGEEGNRTRKGDDPTEGPPLKKRTTAEDRSEERARTDSAPEAPALSKVRGRSREDPSEGSSPIAGQGSAVKRNRRDGMQEEEDIREAESVEATNSSVVAPEPSSVVPSLSKKRETRDSADSLESSELNGSTRRATKLARAGTNELLEEQQEDRESALAEDEEVGSNCCGDEEESELPSNPEDSTTKLSAQPTGEHPAQNKDVAVARAALQRCRERIEAVMEDILQRQVRDIQDLPL